MYKGLVSIIKRLSFVFSAILMLTASWIHADQNSKLCDWELVDGKDTLVHPDPQSVPFPTLADPSLHPDGQYVRWSDERQRLFQEQTVKEYNQEQAKLKGKTRMILVELPDGTRTVEVVNVVTKEQVEELGVKADSKAVKAWEGLLDHLGFQISFGHGFGSGRSSWRTSLIYMLMLTTFEANKMGADPSSKVGVDVFSKVGKFASSFIETLAEIKYGLEKGKARQDQGHFVSILGSAPSLMGHQGGARVNEGSEAIPEEKNFFELSEEEEKKYFSMDLDASVEHLAKYLQRRKALFPKAPLLVVGRSSSPMLYAEVIKRYPDLIDGAVMMSPVMPGDFHSLRKGKAGFEYLASIEGQYGINEFSASWAAYIAQQGTIWTDGFFGNVPVLIITGSDDLEVCREERAQYRNLAANNKNVLFYDFRYKQHDVLDVQVNEQGALQRSEAKKDMGWLAYKALLTFFAGVFGNAFEENSFATLNDLSEFLSQKHSLEKVDFLEEERNILTEIERQNKLVALELFRAELPRNFSSETEPLEHRSSEMTPLERIIEQGKLVAAKKKQEEVHFNSNAGLWLAQVIENIQEDVGRDLGYSNFSFSGVEAEILELERKIETLAQTDKEIEISRDEQIRALNAQKKILLDKKTRILNSKKSPLAAALVQKLDLFREVLQKLSNVPSGNADAITKYKKALVAELKIFSGINEKAKGLKVGALSLEKAERVKEKVLALQEAKLILEDFIAEVKAIFEESSEEVLSALNAEIALLARKEEKLQTVVLNEPEDLSQEIRSLLLAQGFEIESALIKKMAAIEDSVKKIEKIPEEKHLEKHEKTVLDDLDVLSGANKSAQGKKTTALGDEKKAELLAHLNAYRVEKVISYDELLKRAQGLLEEEWLVASEKLEQVMSPALRALNIRIKVLEREMSLVGNRVFVNSTRLAELKFELEEKKALRGLVKKKAQEDETFKALNEQSIAVSAEATEDLKNTVEELWSNQLSVVSEESSSYVFYRYLDMFDRKSPVYLWLKMDDHKDLESPENTLNKYPDLVELLNVLKDGRSSEFDQQKLREAAWSFWQYVKNAYALQSSGELAVDHPIRDVFDVYEDFLEVIQDLEYKILFASHIDGFGLHPDKVTDRPVQGAYPSFLTTFVDGITTRYSGDPKEVERHYKEFQMRAKGALGYALKYWSEIPIAP